MSEHSINIDEKTLEEAFLKEKVNMNIANGSAVTNIKSDNSGGLIITKSEEVDQYLKNAYEERNNFKMSRNTQDHMTKIASVPRILYDAIMEECDKLQITNKKDRQKYLITKLKSKEFEAFLSVPKGMIRGN